MTYGWTSAIGLFGALLPTRDHHHMTALDLISQWEVTAIDQAKGTVRRILPSRDYQLPSREEGNERTISPAYALIGIFKSNLLYWSYCSLKRKSSQPIQGS